MNAEPETLYTLSHPAIAAEAKGRPVRTRRDWIVRGVSLRGGGRVHLSAEMIGGQWMTSPQRIRAFLATLAATHSEPRNHELEAGTRDPATDPAATPQRLPER